MAKAAPDDYTLLMASGEMAINPHLFPKLPYDTDKDRKPQSNAVKVPNVVTVNLDVPVIAEYKPLSNFELENFLGMYAPVRARRASRA